VTKRQALLLLALAIGFLAASLVPQAIHERRLAERKRLQEEARRANLAEYQGPNLEILGNADAPLKAIWCLPNRPITKGGLAIIEEVKAYVRQHPDRVNLTILKMNTPEGDEVMKAHNLDCAGITIDGISGFRVWDRSVGHSRNVLLEKAPAERGWKAADVIDVFEQWLENRGHLPRNRTLGMPGVPPQPAPQATPR